MLQGTQIDLDERIATVQECRNSSMKRPLPCNPGKTRCRPTATTRARLGEVPAEIGGIMNY